MFYRSKSGGNSRDFSAPPSSPKEPRHLLILRHACDASCALPRASCRSQFLPHLASTAAAPQALDDGGSNRLTSAVVAATTLALHSRAAPRAAAADCMILNPSIRSVSLQERVRGQSDTLMMPMAGMLRLFWTACWPILHAAAAGGARTRLL